MSRCITGLQLLSHLCSLMLTTGIPFLAGAEASLSLHSVPYSHGNTSKPPTNKDGSTSSKNKLKKKGHKL